MIFHAKAYSRLEDIASKYECTRDDLIHLGALGKLPIYVLSDGWYVEVYNRQFWQHEEAAGCAGLVPQESQDPTAITTDITGPYAAFAGPKAEVITTYGVYRKQVGTEYLTGPVRLYPQTLEIYEANPKLTAYVFFCEPPHQIDNVVYEYRLIPQADEHQQKAISLEKCRLVVLHENLPLLESLTSSAVKKASLNEIDTVLKQLGLLAWLLFDADSGFKIGTKPNANQIAIKAAALIEKNSSGTKVLGTGESTIRNNIKKGLELVLDK